VQIRELNTKLNAFITILADQAFEEAKNAEEEIKAGNWRSPLHGIPVGIKDFYDTAGIKTTAAFEHFKDRIPTKDATGVAKLKEAGTIIIGKMNMHKLGMGRNLTVTVISPSAISEQFRDFWGVYGGFVGIFAGGFVGAFAKLMFDRRKKRNENE
jgi:aspartyl-tRNA(Asn)/glutamyl-tRNA(Gln) amidotransferase subunit A